MTDSQSNPLLQPWQTPFGLPPFGDDRARAFHSRVRARDARAPRRGRRDRGQRRGTDASRTRWSPSTSPAASSAASPSCSSTSPRPRRRRRCRPSSARCRRASRRTTARSISMRGLFERIDRLHRRRGDLRARRGTVAVARARAPRFRSRRRAAFAAAKARLRRDRRASRDAVDALQPERARRRGELPPRAATRARSRRPARRAARGGRERRAATRRSRRLGDHAVALADRAVPDVLRPARSARAGVQCVDPPRRERRRARQSADRARDPRAAQRAGAPARLRELRRLRAGRPDGGHARRRSRKLLAQVWEPAKARAAAERDALAAMALAHGETHPIEPWDWRYYAEKVRKARYGFDDAMLKPYFSLDRMLGAAFDTAQPPVRPQLRRAPGHPRVSPRRAGVRGPRPRRADRSASSCPTISRARPSAAARG